MIDLAILVRWVLPVVASVHRGEGDAGSTEEGESPVSEVRFIPQDKTACE